VSACCTPLIQWQIDFWRHTPLPFPEAHAPLLSLLVFFLAPNPDRGRVVSLRAVDFAIIVIYFAMALGIGFYLAKYTQSGEDFFLALGGSLRHFAHKLLLHRRRSSGHDP
jgi:hypothetical protein